MADAYRDVTLERLRAADAIDLSLPLVADVAAAFDAIPEHGHRLPCSVPVDVFTGERRERYREVTNPGLNRTDNHLQGIQRSGEYIYLSAGDLTESRAHLLVVRHAPASGSTPARATLERVLAVDHERDHGGGIQRCGNVIAMALEGDRIGATVEFIHIGDPAHPRLIPDARIACAATKASAAALAVLPLDGTRILAGVTWFRPGRFLGVFGGSRAWLDLYLSRSADLREGFLPAPVRIEVTKLTERAPAWQSIAFLPTRDAGEVMLVGTRSSSSAPGGTATADLCRLRLAPGLPAAWPDVQVIAEHVRSRTFRFDRDWGDFAAAAGIECEADGRLTLLAAAHFRFADGFRLSICSAPAGLVA